jgi:hypothetical protein
MDWIRETLEHVQGTEELRTVAESFLRSDPETQQVALRKLWEFTGSLEGEEKTKFTVMATILETAAEILNEQRSQE